MDITVEKEPIKQNLTAVRKERLMWVKLPKQSFPVSIHFWEYQKGTKRQLIAIEVRGNYIQKWESRTNLWQLVTQSVAYEMNLLSGQILPENNRREVVAEIKKQVKTDKIHIEDGNIIDDE